MRITKKEWKIKVKDMKEFGKEIGMVVLKYNKRGLGHDEMIVYLTMFCITLEKGMDDELKKYSVIGKRRRRK